MAADEDPVFIQHGDVPSCTVTWEWGRDESDGSRIDRYVGNDGNYYERIIPKGGGYCPEVQGTISGLEPFWQRIGRVR
jgi:hypothetical protein